MNAPLALIDVRGWVGERGGLLLWGPLDLVLHPAEVVHVQGPNGCGKTTLLRMLAGLREPALGGPGRLCDDFWWLGHAGALAEELDALLNLRLLLGVAGVPGLAPRALADCLAARGVPPDRAARLLSAGQRRKLALAPLALVPRPLWLLDEPFDGLDQAACAALAALAADHVARGGAIVLTSHQPLPSGFPEAKNLLLSAPNHPEQLSIKEHA